MKVPLITPLGSDVTSCQLSCYRDPDKFCIDQGEGIAPYDRYQCVSCSDLCPGPNDDPDITSVSLTCIENCKEYLQQQTLNKMYSSQGFLGSSLGLDVVFVCVIGILMVTLLVVVFLQHKKMKNIKRQMPREVRNSVSGVSYAAGS
ncbi:uncharacterized protein [Ptychodera flava]|uniref:uncharacterized protein n=1 Tax=Ptychodera flava TaxID=63121 RepID=UPI00396A59E4